MTGQVAEYFRQGGIFMYPLLFFSVLAATVAVERFIVFSKAKINVNAFLTQIRKALLVNRNVKEAIKVCEQNKSPVASVMKAGLLRYGQPREEIEKTIENAALYELDRLEKRLGLYRDLFLLLLALVLVLVLLMVQLLLLVQELPWPKI